MPLENAANAVSDSSLVIFCFSELLTDICPTNGVARQVEPTNENARLEGAWQADCHERWAEEKEITEFTKVVNILSSGYPHSD